MRAYFINQWKWDSDFWGDFTIVELTIYKDIPNTWSMQIILMGIGYNIELRKGIW